MVPEDDIIDSLQAIGYNGVCLQSNILSNALKAGIPSLDFKQLISFLTNEIHILQNTDESINTIDNNEGFVMELSSLLKELQCPFSEFISGPISNRFNSIDSLISLIEYLVAELMSARMLKINCPDDKTYDIQKIESPTAKALIGITKELELGKPPENISPKALFDKVSFKLEEKVRECNPKRLRDPLFKRSKPLTDEQWHKLEKVCKDMDNEYNKRREVLITRLKVTIESFSWSDRTKQKENDITRSFKHFMESVEALSLGGNRTDIVALLAARTDLPIIEKTSCANVRKNTQSSVNKHIIGNVPDRGGRAYEHAIPAPEMPSWQIQRSQGGGGGGGRGRGGGRGGFDQRPQGQRPPRQQQGNNWAQESGRVQGAGWTQKGGGNYNDNRNYQENRGSYQDNRGGGYQGGNNYQNSGLSEGGNYQGGNNYGDNRAGGGSNYYNRNQGDDNRGGGGGGGYQNNRGGYNRGGGGRGQSNYNRGGGYNNRR